MIVSLRSPFDGTVSAIEDLTDEAESLEEHCMESLMEERRSSARESVYVPLFVYGHGSAEEPFYQETNTLQVNANGALLHLDDDVNVCRGQKLLVMNRLTKEEQECYIVTLTKRPKRADLRVGVAFAKAAPEFWTRRKKNPSR